MKVKITYEEVQYFKNEAVVEMTATEFNAYEKSGFVPKRVEMHMSGITGDECHTQTETFNISAEKM